MGTLQENSLVETPDRAEKSNKAKPPPYYQVVMLNDDFTPMEFVVLLLQTFFGMEQERATMVMLQIHQQGRGICGMFPKDIAETKCSQVIRAAKENQYPLKCVIERKD